MNPDTITTTEAARRLGVTSQTIRNWIRSGKIHTEPTLGGHNRIPKDQPVLVAAASVTDLGSDDL
jgi:excisionase family DNA binding protein